MDLHLLWFVLLGVLMTGYAILDGFDLGVGIVHPWFREEHERRLALNSIGPLWDGNEVWLVTFGGALFAAFPPVYAAVLSGFYLPVMVLLAGLIGRAISIEFRSKRPSSAWRRYWDASFFLSSFVVTFIFGLLLGNVLRGVPIGPSGLFAGSWVDLLHPYPIAVGLLAVAGAAMHGTIYLHLKLEGPLQARVEGWMWRSYFVFAALWLPVSVATVLEVPHALDNFEHLPLAWVVVVLNILAIANIPRAIAMRRSGYAFVSSSATIAAFIFLVAMALHPNLVISSLDRAYDLNIYTSSSSEATLLTMAIIAAIGVPFVVTYTAVIYWLFRGKVSLDSYSV